MRLISFLILGLGLNACDHKSSKTTAPIELKKAYDSDVQSAIRDREKLKPTRPSGGIDNDRVGQVNAGENAERAMRNRKESVMWGDTAAGISFRTTYSESVDILSTPIGVSGTFHYYAENVRIAWSQEGKRNPQLIVVDNGYLGRIVMPDSVGMVKMGDSFSRYFTNSDPQAEQLLIKLGQFFEKKPSTFNCLALNVCSIREDDSYLEFVFRNGGLIFKNNPLKTLEIFYFEPTPRPLTEPLTAPVVFGDSAGGIAMLSNYADGYPILGDPMAVSGNTFYYDNGNFGVVWDLAAPNKAKVMVIDKGYQGVIQLPAPYGNVHMRDSFSQYFTAQDPRGEAMLKDLARTFDGHAGDANWDCMQVNSCQAYASIEGVDYVFDKGGMIFDEKGRLVLLYFVIPPVARTTPLTLAATFPTALGTLDFSMVKADAEANVLGSPRSVSSDGKVNFYDNENVSVVWKATDPKVPEYIQINQGYRGVVSAPVGLGTVQMGKVFAASFPSNDLDGNALIKDLSIFYRNEASGYDCLQQATCEVVREGDYILFLFKDHGFWAFTNDNQKSLVHIGFDPKQKLSE